MGFEPSTCALHLYPPLVSSMCPLCLSPTCVSNARVLRLCSPRVFSSTFLIPSPGAKA